MYFKSVSCIIILGSILTAGFPIDLTRLEPGKKPDGRYKVWIYFTDKDESGSGISSRITAHPNTIRRRQKVGIGSKAVWYDQYPSEKYIAAVINTGAELQQQSRWFNSISVIATGDQLQVLAQLPFVKDIRPVMTYRRKVIKPRETDDRSGRTGSDTLYYGYAREQIEQINAHLAHAAGLMGQGVTVLVLDTGFNLTHPAFDSLIIVGEKDFIEDDSITANQTESDTLYGQHNHGTKVLSVLAGYAPGHLIGPAFKAQFLLAKTEIVAQEIQLEEDNYVAGLEWGEAKGADVASSSLGYLDWYTYADLDGNTAVTTRAVDKAVELGMVCVTAAGNEGSDDWYYIIAPADADSVISVGAVNSAGTIWFGSSHGPTFDGRIKPEVCARGALTACVTPDDNNYTTGYGTSLATPLVSGSVAMILSAHPNWTPMMVREALMMTASQADNPDNDYGYGIIDVWAAINYDKFVDLIPQVCSLSPVYPNPFNNTTYFQVNILIENRVRVAVYDIQGKELVQFMEGFNSPGIYDFNWKANEYASGVYLIRLEWDGGSMTRKATLLK